MLERNVDLFSDDDQYLVMNKEEEGDDEMISCWSGDDGDWFLDEVRRDFPNEGKDLYDMTEATHVWEPLKKEDWLKKDKGRNGKPWERKKKEFIMPTMGPINNWTWVGFSENMGKKFCNTSSNVLWCVP